MKEYAKPTNLEEAEILIEEIKKDMQELENQSNEDKKYISELQKKNTENFNIIMGMGMNKKEENKEEQEKIVTVEDIIY